MLGLQLHSTILKIFSNLNVFVLYVHHGLETATGHVHEQVVIIESSFSLKIWVLSKSGLVLTCDFDCFGVFLEVWFIFRKSPCVGKIK